MLPTREFPRVAYQIREGWKPSALGRCANGCSSEAAMVTRQECHEALDVLTQAVVFVPRDGEQTTDTRRADLWPPEVLAEIREMEREVSQHADRQARQLPVHYFDPEFQLVMGVCTDAMDRL